MPSVCGAAQSGRVTLALHPRCHATIAWVTATRPARCRSCFVAERWFSLLLVHARQDVDALRKSINSGEGCRIRGIAAPGLILLAVAPARCRRSGFVKVNKVPGRRHLGLESIHFVCKTRPDARNLHLSTYSHSFLFGSLYQDCKGLRGRISCLRGS